MDAGTDPARSRRVSCGFTIIEMSIAIVLIGIFLGMSLKGRALLESYKALFSAYEIQRIQHAVKFYESAYSALPGDDQDAPHRFERPPSTFNLAGGTVSFAGDGVINGHFFDLDSTNGEQFMAWRDLRSSHAVPGDPSLTGPAAMPEDAFGGVYGFDEGNLGQNGGSICLTRVPGRAASIIDRWMDDGVINKGKIVATSKWSPGADQNHFDQPDDAPYDFEKEYIVCAPLLP